MVASVEQCNQGSERVRKAENFIHLLMSVIS